MGMQRRCVCEKLRCNVCGHFVGLVAETIVNMHGSNASYNKIPCENGCEAGEEIKHSLQWFHPWRQAKYTFKAVAVSLPAPGADPKSEPDGFSHESQLAQAANGPP